MSTSPERVAMTCSLLGKLGVSTSMLRYRPGSCPLHWLGGLERIWVAGAGWGFGADGLALHVSRGESVEGGGGAGKGREISSQDSCFNNAPLGPFPAPCRARSACALHRKLCPAHGGITAHWATNIVAVLHSPPLLQSLSKASMNTAVHERSSCSTTRSTFYHLIPFQNKHHPVASAHPNPKQMLHHASLLTHCPYSLTKKHPSTCPVAPQPQHTSPACLRCALLGLLTPAPRLHCPLTVLLPLPGRVVVTAAAAATNSPGGQDKNTQQLDQLLSNLAQLRQQQAAGLLPDNDAGEDGNDEDAAAAWEQYEFPPEMEGIDWGWWRAEDAAGASPQQQAGAVVQQQQQQQPQNSISNSSTPSRAGQQEQQLSSNTSSSSNSTPSRAGKQEQQTHAAKPAGDAQGSSPRRRRRRSSQQPAQ